MKHAPRHLRTRLQKVSPADPYVSNWTSKGVRALFFLFLPWLFSFICCHLFMGMTGSNVFLLASSLSPSASLLLASFPRAYLLPSFSYSPVALRDKRGPRLNWWLARVHVMTITQCYDADLFTMYSFFPVAIQVRTLVAFLSILPLIEVAGGTCSKTMLVLTL